MIWLSAHVIWHASHAGDEAGGGVDARALSHFFFVLGQVALQHLVHVETLAKRIRKQAASKEKALAEAASERITSGQAPAQGATPFLPVSSLTDQAVKIFTRAS